MNTRNLLRSLSVTGLMMGAAALSFTGCATSDADDGEDVGQSTMTFEEFEARVYQEPETGIYIVNGDTPVETRAKLKEFFEKFIQPGALIVDTSDGVDDRWSDTQKLNLTYCVSTTFGANYSAVVQAMADATAAWEQIAYVRFNHVIGQDSACIAGNTNVLFDVNPTSGQPYLARAFLPNFTRASRNILIDASSFGAIAPYTLAGILRHE